jgi:hypothetical protein
MPGLKILGGATMVETPLVGASGADKNEGRLLGGLKKENE